MNDRRRFLSRSLQLGALGLGAGLTGGCSTPRPPGPVAVDAPPAPSAPPGAIASPPSISGGEPVPPPDLFDASLLPPDFWVRPRTIDWIRPQTQETLRLVYWKEGVVDPGAYERMCHLLRDVDARKTIQIDPKLLETLWACQAFCARYGMRHPLQILSGYRTPATNDRLVEQGLSAARKSLHLDGRAADVRIIDLNSEVLGDLVKSFERGGVGFYARSGASSGWIHTDTGVNRVWHG